MVPLKPLSPHVSVGPQIHTSDMALLSAEGFTSVINNRPDGEDALQPRSAELEVAANAAGLRYLHVPVHGMPTESAVAATTERLTTDATYGGRTAMFCRSGMRSAAVWAMAQRRGGVDPDDLRAAAAAAGYDLSRLPL